MGARKFTKDELIQKWEDYKNYCNNQIVTVHDFSSKNSEFVSADLRKSITCTIEGFCVFLGLTRSTFYANYANHKRYADIVTRIREESEVDARAKFETGVIPTQLAGLWMSKYGYSTKTDHEVTANEELRGFLDAVRPDPTAMEELFASEEE